MLWTIVLAGGSGTRLGEVNRWRYGYARPKQYCDYDGRGTLLERTLHRARRHAPPQRTVVVTTRAHRAEASHALREHPDVVRVEQPCGRDTTPGLLLPLLHVLARDPEATVVVLPSDHYVADEARLADAVQVAIDVVTVAPDDRIALLGAEPDEEAGDYGWLVPTRRGASTVRAFREKPSPPEVAALRRDGARVNTFVLVARAQTLADAIAVCAPAWWRTLSPSWCDPARLDAIYDVCPPSNFSRDVLEAMPDRLDVVPLPASAGWSDVGTPERLVRAFGPDAVRGIAPVVEMPTVRSRRPSATAAGARGCERAVGAGRR